MFCFSSNRYDSHAACIAAESACAGASSSRRSDSSSRSSASPGSSSAGSAGSPRLLAHWTFDDLSVGQGNRGEGIDAGLTDEYSNAALASFNYAIRVDRSYESWPQQPPFTEATCGGAFYDSKILVDRECLATTTPCNAALCLWRDSAPEPNYSHFITVAPPDQPCSSVPPPSGGYVPRGEYCVKPVLTPPPPRCLERICIWGKPSSTPRQALLSAAGPSASPVTCAGSPPADRFTLVSAACRERNAAGGCLAEVCLWEKTPQCFDGVDNDGDGLIDSADPGCTGTGDDNERYLSAFSPRSLLSRMLSWIRGIGTQTSLVAQVLPNSLVATDFSGNGNNGTISGARPAANGCLWFDGVDDYVSVPNFDRQRFTFAGFAKKQNPGRGYPPLIVSSNKDGFGIGYVKGMGSTTENTSFPDNMAPTGPARVFLSKTEGRFFRYTPADVSADIFHHIAVTYDGATVKFYIDGVRVSEQAYAETFNGGGNYLLGLRRSTAGHPATGQEYVSAFRGFMDDVRIYDGPLSDSEIATLASGTPCVLQVSSSSRSSSSSSSTYTDSSSSSRSSFSSSSRSFSSSSSIHSDLSSSSS
ncbi:hypothetical protein HYS30_00290, partial [Candidatus Peregrinibacteria bacterium]|nr:hypothetical protein [Candidatus Peregrinibacteria bacterium]